MQQPNENVVIVYDDKIPPARHVPRGISAAKKHKIMKDLVPRMDSSRHPFWENLPESESSEDLLKTFE